MSKASNGVKMMADDPLMVAIVEAAQAAGAASCRAAFSAGGRIRIWTPLYGGRRHALEQTLRWKLPEYLEPMVLMEGSE